MRISTSWAQHLALQDLLNGKARLVHTRRQISTGKRILVPSDDPVGATQALGLTKVIGRTAQYDRNIDAATDRLNHEEHALSSVTKLLQSVRQKALEANNDTQTNQTRSYIAIEFRQRIDQLLQIANMHNGRGEYIFSGYSTKTQPFSKTTGGVVYKGDQGQRLFQIGESQKVAAGDNGAEIFQHILNGNGTFSVSSATANTGTGIIGATSVTDPTLYDGGAYTVTFTAANTYEVKNSGGTVVTTGTYTEGQAIGFKGIQFALKGVPATGDQFTVAPSENQSIFETLNNLTNALGTSVTDKASRAQLHNKINSALNGIDQALNHMLKARARVGARLNDLQNQKTLHGGYSLQLKSRLSKVQDVDYAAAASRMSTQLTMLQAAQKAFIKVQGLSLFKFLG